MFALFYEHCSHECSGKELLGLSHTEEGIKKLLEIAEKNPDFVRQTRSVGYRSDLNIEEIELDKFLG